MRCAVSLTAGALAAALLLGGTGTTAAAWRADAPVEHGALSSGVLDVAFAPAGQATPDPVVLEPGAKATVDYDLGTSLRGDNLDALLRLSAPAWQDAQLLDVLDISVEVALGGAAVAEGTLDGDGAFRFAGSPNVPVDLPRDADGQLSVTLVVTMDAAAGNTYQGLRLDDGDLVADLWQVRSGATVDESRLWHDTAAALAPAVSSGTVEIEVDSARQAPEAATPDVADDDATSTTEPTTEPSTEPSTEPTEAPETEPTETPEAPETDTGPGREPEPAPDVDSGPDSGPDENGPDEGGDTSEDPEPAWAQDLRDLLDEEGLDAAGIDLDALPAVLEEWAADQEVPLDDLIAWLEKEAS
ncbi:hypothetical protein [Isoptericola sp. NPDC055881]